MTLFLPKFTKHFELVFFFVNEYLRKLTFEINIIYHYNISNNLS